MRSLFDEATGVVNLDEDIAATPSFQNILADGVVTDEEIAEHQQRLLNLLGELDEQLQGDVHEKVREVLVEIAVFYAIQRVRETQDLFGSLSDVMS